MSSINFFFEDVNFTLRHRLVLKHWLRSVVSSFHKEIGCINIIFCSDEYLHKINVDYLSHDYYTDIITFDHSENAVINGDLFISYDRLRDNAKLQGQATIAELQRVMVHGVLHLLGLKDKSAEEQKKMTAAENKFLAMMQKTP